MKSLKFKKTDLCYFIGLFFLTLKYYFSVSEIFYSNYLDFSLMALGYIFLLLKCFCDIRKIEELIKLISLLLIGGIIYLKDGITLFLTLIIVIYSSKEINFKKIVRFLFYIGLYITIIHVLFYIIYLLFDFESLNIFSRHINNKVLYRYAFFFNHPNTFSIIVFWLYLMYIYLHYDDISIGTYLSGLLLSLFIYFFPNSRTSALVMILTILIIIISKKSRKLKFKSKNLKIFLILINIICLVALKTNDNPLVIKIDDLLSARISVATTLYQNYGLHLFGNNISGGTKLNFINGKYITSVKIVDSVYYSLIINSGIIAYSIYIYCLLKILKKIKLDKYKKERIIMLVLIIYGLSETTCISPVIGFPIIMLYSNINQN